MTRTELLASIPAFASLAADDLGTLAERLDEERFEAGRIIVEEGDASSTSLYIVEEGEVEISRGRDKGRVKLAMMGAGQYFGELALIDGSPRSATVTAKSPVRALVLERPDFVDFMHRDPDAAMRVMADLAARLRHTNDLVAAATEDMQRMGGMEALDAPYRPAPVWQMIQKRAGWLSVLFLGEMLTATAMGHFEDEIAARRRAGAVRAAHHLVRRQLGLAGNVAHHPRFGARRVGAARLAAGSAPRDLFGRGARVPIGRRSASCASCFGRFSAGPTTDRTIWRVALTVWASLVGVVASGQWPAACCRSACAALGFDPATRSAPFVATLVDVTGLVIYFTIASVILRGLVL